jgi:hypothetical protein
MALLGTGALAMWWDMASDMRAEFEDWHSHEHFPERMSIAGFRRGTRWISAAGDDGVFVLYEVDSHAILSSADYVAHLNTPTPWSTKMMPHHRNMVRSQCDVLHTHGGAVARHALTVRLDAATGRDDELRARLALLARTLASQPGLVGAHLLRHRAPALALTREQKIRNGVDRVAHNVLVVYGYGLDALRAVMAAGLADGGSPHGAAPGHVAGLYTLSYSATPGDVV